MLTFGLWQENQSHPLLHFVGKNLTNHTTCAAPGALDVEIVDYH